MTVRQRDAKRPDESEDDFAKRDDAHWEKVRADGAKLQAARDRHARRMRQ